MIRATAHAAPPRPAARRTTARRLLLPIGALMTLLALVGPAVVGQQAVAYEPPRGGGIQVVTAGVAFTPGQWSDGVAYVIRPWGSRDDGQAFSRTLTPEEQSSGWAAFWEAGSAYPDGYCLVWVEVENAGSWHETGRDSVCTATEPTTAAAPPHAARMNDRALAATAAEPSAPATVSPPKPAPAPSAPPPTPMSTPAPTSARPPTPTPAPVLSPSTSAASTGPSTPATTSPSPSSTSPDTTRGTTPETTPGAATGPATAQDAGEQPTARTQAGAAEQQEIISPLGWVAVLGGGAVLTAGGTLVLWHRFT